MSWVPNRRVPELLFYEKNADLFFKWEDGTKIPAHTFVVFRKVEFFK